MLEVVDTGSSSKWVGFLPPLGSATGQEGSHWVLVCFCSCRSSYRGRLQGIGFQHSWARSPALLVSIRPNPQAPKASHAVPRLVPLQPHNPLCLTHGLESWISCHGPCAPHGPLLGAVPPSWVSPSYLLSVAGPRTTASLSRAAAQVPCSFPSCLRRLSPHSAL